MCFCYPFFCCCWRDVCCKHSPHVTKCYSLRHWKITVLYTTERIGELCLFGDISKCQKSFQLTVFIYTWDKHKFLDMTCKTERRRYHLRVVVQSEFKLVYMNDFCIALEEQVRDMWWSRLEEVSCWALSKVLQGPELDGSCALPGADQEVEEPSLEELCLCTSIC